MKLQLDIENMDCANCASALERALSKQREIVSVSANFITKRLDAEFLSGTDENFALKLLGRVSRRDNPALKLFTAGGLEVTSPKFLKGKGRRLLHGQESGMQTGGGGIYNNRSAAHGSGCCGTPLDEAAACAEKGCCSDGSDNEHDHDGRGCAHDCDGGNRSHDYAHGHDHSYGHSHDHSHSHGADGVKFRLWFIAASAAMFIAGFFAQGALHVALFVASYIAAGWPVLTRAGANIIRGKVFDENFLMSAASLGAFAIGEYHDAAAVMLLYQIGELFQELAVARSRKSITELMDIRPDYAVAIREGIAQRVSPEEVRTGELIQVRPGEKVPLDGVVEDGNSALNVSALTGEPLPVDVSLGGEVLSGSVNLTGVLTVRVSRPFEESTVSKILRLVQSSGAKKARSENFITQFARYYTPAVVAAAALTALIPGIITGDFNTWVSRALIFLVISCPCALVISVPLTFFGGIGGASRQGILIKGGSYLDALSKTGTVAFDKTGTLTKGIFEVVKIMPHGMDEGEFLKIAAHAESLSNHPIARSVLKAYGGDIDRDALSDYTESAGAGVSAELWGKRVLCGKAEFLQSKGVDVPETSAEEEGTVIHLAHGGSYAGALVISDTVKESSARAVFELGRRGISTVMLTGDSRSSARRAAEQMRLDSVYAELLPQDKVRLVEELQSGMEKGKKLVFAGDGINDAPSLARADISVAMGAMGSDAAIEAADVVLMTDEPYRIVTAIDIAKKTRRIVTQNIAFALTVKAVAMALGTAGILGMTAAVLADVGVALISILNAMRMLKKLPDDTPSAPYSPASEQKVAVKRA